MKMQYFALIAMSVSLSASDHRNVPLIAQQRDLEAKSRLEKFNLFNVPSCHLSLFQDRVLIPFLYQHFPPELVELIIRYYTNGTETIASPVTLYTSQKRSQTFKISIPHYTFLGKKLCPLKNIYQAASIQQLLNAKPSTLIPYHQKTVIIDRDGHIQKVPYNNREPRDFTVNDDTNILVILKDDACSLALEREEERKAAPSFIVRLCQETHWQHPEIWKIRYQDSSKVHPLEIITFGSHKPTNALQWIPLPRLIQILVQGGYISEGNTIWWLSAQSSLADPLFCSLHFYTVTRPEARTISSSYKKPHLALQPMTLESVQDDIDSINARREPIVIRLYTDNKNPSTHADLFIDAPTPNCYKETPKNRNNKRKAW